MGHYLNNLLHGELYELNGQRLEFFKKQKGLYYFYVYVYNEQIFDYEKTTTINSFSFKELNFLKRVQDKPICGLLKKIGKDKVWQI